MQRHRSPEAFFANHPQWADVLVPLRELLCASELSEEIKWGVPTYTLAGKNVVGLAAFKHHAALWFHQGALIDDPDGLLINAQEGKTRALRQLRFDSPADLDLEKVAALLQQAIDNEKAGRRVAKEPSKLPKLPDELLSAMAVDSDLKQAFDALTPGRQREYAAHVGGAKQAATRQRRLKKAIPMILAGKGLNDHYRC